MTDYQKEKKKILAGLILGETQARVMMTVSMVLMLQLMHEMNRTREVAERLSSLEDRMEKRSEIYSTDSIWILIALEARIYG